MAAVGGVGEAGLTRERLSVPRRFDARWAAIGGATALIAWLCLVPLGFLIWRSFTPAQGGGLTLENYVRAYSSAQTVRLFGASLAFAAGTASFALVLGASFAWLCERTNAPLRSLFVALALTPLVIPGVLFVVSWIMLASPKIGILNLTLKNALGLQASPFNVYTIPGMAFVEGLHSSPIAFLLMSASLRSMDPALEESALMSGAPGRALVRRITVPLVWPALAASFLILFVRALEAFETPTLLGLPAGIEVFTSAIYDALHGYPSQVGLACAYAATLIAITSFGIWRHSALTRNAKRFATLTGKATRPRRLDLGRWRWLAGGLFLLYGGLVVGLPFLVLLWSSLQRFYSVPSWAALRRVSLASYSAVLSYPDFSGAVWNSVVLAVCAATAATLIGAVASWLVLRSRLRGAWIVDNVASTPLVIPGLVFGLAIMIFYLAIGGAIYDTLWIILVAYVARFLPYGMRFNGAALLQIHPELEEAAEASGASWGVSFRRVVLPLIAPGLLASWLYVAIVSVRELSSSILLYSPGNEVISVVIWELWQNGQYVQLSALGVMLMVCLFAVVALAQLITRRFAVNEA